MCNQCDCEHHTHEHDVTDKRTEIPVVQAILSANDQAAKYKEMGSRLTWWEAQR